MKKQRKRVAEVPTPPPTGLPDGIREVVMTMQGRRVVVRINDREGTQHIDRLAEDGPEVLEHRFPVCPVCEEQHMAIGDETPTCPRTGWQTGAWGVPFYPTGTRVMEEQVREANVFNRSVSRDLGIIAREIEKQTGLKV